MKQLSKGFTLIELMVVIAIIALLSSVVFASVSSARSRAQTAKTIQLIHQYVVALNEYYADHGEYPQPGGVNTAYAFSDNPEIVYYSPTYALGDVSKCPAGTIKPAVSNQLNNALLPYYPSYPNPAPNSIGIYIGGSKNCGVSYHCSLNSAGVCLHVEMSWVMESPDFSCPYPFKFAGAGDDVGIICDGSL